MKVFPRDPISLAVYPLTSMMEDEVKHLIKKEISVAYASKYENPDADIKASRLRIVFRSPELLVGNKKMKRSAPNRCVLGKCLNGC